MKILLAGFSFGILILLSGRCEGQLYDNDAAVRNQEIYLKLKTAVTDDREKDALSLAVQLLRAMPINGADVSDYDRLDALSVIQSFGALDEYVRKVKAFYKEDTNNVIYDLLMAEELSLSDTTAAIPFLEAAHKIAPQDGLISSRLAKLYATEHNEPFFLTYLTSLFDSDGEIPADVDLFGVFERAGKESQLAQLLAKRIRKEGPRSTTHFNTRSRFEREISDFMALLKKEGRTDDAIVLERSLVDTDTINPLVYQASFFTLERLDLMELLEKKGDRDGVGEQCQAILFPKDPNQELNLITDYGLAFKVIHSAINIGLYDQIKANAAAQLPSIRQPGLVEEKRALILVYGHDPEALTYLPGYYAGLLDPQQQHYTDFCLIYPIFDELLKWPEAKAMLKPTVETIYHLYGSGGNPDAAVVIANLAMEIGDSDFAKEILKSALNNLSTPQTINILPLPSLLIPTVPHMIVLKHASIAVLSFSIPGFPEIQFPDLPSLPMSIQIQTPSGPPFTSIHLPTDLSLRGVIGFPKIQIPSVPSWPSLEDPTTPSLPTVQSSSPSDLRLLRSPYSAGSPYGSRYPSFPGGSFMPGGLYGPGGPNTPGGSNGPGGLYGPGGLFGPGGRYGPQGPYILTPMLTPPLIAIPSEGAPAPIPLDALYKLAKEMVEVGMADELNKIIPLLNDPARSYPGRYENLVSLGQSAADAGLMPTAELLAKAACGDLEHDWPDVSLPINAIDTDSIQLTADLLGRLQLFDQFDELEKVLSKPPGSPLNIKLPEVALAMKRLRGIYGENPSGLTPCVWIDPAPASDGPARKIAWDLSGQTVRDYSNADAISILARDLPRLDGKLTIQIIAGPEEDDLRLVNTVNNANSRGSVSAELNPDDRFLRVIGQTAPPAHKIFIGPVMPISLGPNLIVPGTFQAESSQWGSPPVKGTIDLSAIPSEKGGPIENGSYQIENGTGTYSQVELVGAPQKLEPGATYLQSGWLQGNGQWGVRFLDNKGGTLTDFTGPNQVSSNDWHFVHQTFGLGNEGITTGAAAFCPVLKIPQSVPVVPLHFQGLYVGVREQEPGVAQLEPAPLMEGLTGVNSMVEAPQGNILAMTFTDGSVRCFDLKTHTQLGTVSKLPTTPVDVEFAEQGRVIVAVDTEGHLMVQSMDKPEDAGKIIYQAPWEVGFLGTSSDGSIAVLGNTDRSQSKVVVVDLSTGKQISAIDLRLSVFPVVSADGKMVFFQSSQGVGTLWDTTGRPLSVTEDPPHPLLSNYPNDAGQIILNEMTQARF